MEAGKKAVEAHYKRVGIPATTEDGPFYGTYRTVYHWKENPLISIIIPNKDHVDDLQKCIDSIETKSEYRNYEYIIVENNSCDETLNYYKKLEKENSKVKVVYYKGGFNYSAINNYGSKYASVYYFDPKKKGYLAITARRSVSSQKYKGKGSDGKDYWAGTVITLTEQ